MLEVILAERLEVKELAILILGLQEQFRRDQRTVNRVEPLVVLDQNTIMVRCFTTLLLDSNQLFGHAEVFFFSLKRSL